MAAAHNGILANSFSAPIGAIHVIWTMKKYCVISFIGFCEARHYRIRRSLMYVAAGMLALIAASLPLMAGAIDYLHSYKTILSEQMLLVKNTNQLNLTAAQCFQKELLTIIESLSAIEHTSRINTGPAASPSGRLKAAAQYLRWREQQYDMLESRVDAIENVLEAGADNSAVLPQRIAAAHDAAVLMKHLLGGIPNGYPVAFKGITSAFGRRIHPVLKTASFHNGVDLKAAPGTPVSICADGIVEYAGEHAASGLGNILVVRHNFGFTTTFGHLQNVLVKTGQVVRKHQIVAHSGNSGTSSGPHLHYEIHYVANRLDPEPFLTWNTANFQGMFDIDSIVPWKAIMGLAMSATQDPTRDHSI
jgi:hypothetical protein